jgi:short-subunit dehydrogenase
MVLENVIIVGASSGLGHAIACEYVAMGCWVGITARRFDLLAGIRNRFPDQVVLSCFDVTGNDNHQKMWELVNKLGGMDLLVYCSGFGEPSTELNEEIESRTIRTNVYGFVSIAHFAFNYFMQKGGGQIALISSVAALRGSAMAPAYSASKSFMSNYAEGLNMKAGQMKKDIVITDIRAGFINTKPSKIDNRFWVAGTVKAARQTIKAIEKKKRVAYVTRRWLLVALLMKIMPYSLYRRFV